MEITKPQAVARFAATLPLAYRLSNDEEFYI